MRWGDLAPTFEWRASQRHLLQLASHVDDGRWHLCAPPGSGKTLVGLELARRVGRPALVLSPTTAVRDQWREAVAMFGAEPASFTSSDPASTAPLVSVTYQLLGNPGEAGAELRQAARRLWVADVEAETGEGEARVQAVERHDPVAARREIRARVRRVRRVLERGDDLPVPLAALIGERAHALIEELAARGTGCVVLDECHHLLDWWALVLTALVDELQSRGAVAVIGLTATLPEPESSREAANYLRLLGDVDAELHLPALVAEGAIAPWRDGVVLTVPTEQEGAFLADFAGHFAAELDRVLLDEEFIDWAVSRITAAALEERAGTGPPDADSWSRFWDRDPLTAHATACWWGSRGMALPEGFEPPEPLRPLDVDARLTLVDAWVHDPEGPCPPDRRDDIRKLLGRYGYALTAAGIRSTRSPADIVVSRSSAKGAAAALVLAAELERRGNELRALVVVERDQATTPPAEARAVLGEDSGTAARVLAGICEHPRVVAAGVVAVTGRGMWADALSASRILAEIGTVDATARLRVEGTDIARVVRVQAEGTSWSPARWLAAAEQVLDAGAAQVLVATRALVGEGWDHPALNVLVDVSEAATRTAVTQLRGRALRVDEQRPGKVASLWDVTVVHPVARGDWDRLRRRHRAWWGPTPTGEIALGPGKLHARLALAEPPSTAEIDAVNRESMLAVMDEPATRRAWASADPGGGAVAAVAVRVRRRLTVRVRQRAWRPQHYASLGVAALATAVTPAVGTAGWATGALGVAAAVIGVSLRRGRARDERALLLALGEATRDALVAVGAVGLSRRRVTVTERAGGVAVEVDAEEDAATTWADAFAEVLGPLGSPRWLVVADGGLAWRVPRAASSSKAAAEAFAAAVGRRLPGATLVRAGTPAATRAVLEQARTRRDEIERGARWR